MSSPSFSLYALALLSLSLLVSITPTDTRKEPGSSPIHDANILQHDPLVNAPKIVEKPFRFPSISDADSYGANAQDLGHCAGYIKIHENSSAKVFYYFFKARSSNNKTNVPFIVHSTGGPGFSSSLAMLYENGPFSLTNKLSLVWNKYGWDTLADILFIDQPIGTGFSYSTDVGDIPITSEQAAYDIHEFLQAFMRKNPDYATKDVYISGESYAGHIFPVLAAKILETNTNNQGIHINLKGILISSAWTNPELQFLSYPDYARNMKLVNQKQCNQMRKSFSSCYKQVQMSCDGNNYNYTACVEANVDCNDILWDNIITPTKGINYYDITKKCVPNTTLCYDFSNMERFLNQPSVKKALGVDKNIRFVSWSYEVNDAMANDVMRSFEDYIPDLLENGIKLLIYTGQYDLICNSLGNLKWMSDMKWSGHRSFGSASYDPFKVGGVVAGMVKSSGPLSYVNVYNAGHFVTMDQPQATLEMLRKWINRIPL